MDLRRLRPVFEQKGPYTTIHVEVSRAAEDAEERSEARWTRIRHDLEHHELRPELVERIGQLVQENTALPGEVWRTIVATDHEVVLDDVQAGHNPHGEVLDHAELPELAAWIDHADQALPFLLAVVDRTGADLSAHRALGARPARAETVTGETYYVTKVSEGDWAQKQFQQTAENSWVHNAHLVADGMRSLAARHGTRTAFVAGEVRARAEVVKALHDGEHQHVGPIVEIESGGRAEGASEEALWSEVRERIRDHVAAEDADAAALLEEARGRGEGAATGVDEVLDALAKAQVRRLLIDLDRTRDQEVDPNRHPGLPLPAAAADCSSLPADRVLVAAAALTDAEVTLLAATMTGGDGVSALLRWAD